MAICYLVKINTSIDIFGSEKCKVTFGFTIYYTVRLLYMQ